MDKIRTRYYFMPKNLYMEAIKLDNSEINMLEWDSLLKTEEAATEKDEQHEAAISDYLSRRFNNDAVDFPSIDKEVTFEVDDSLLDPDYDALPELEEEEPEDEEEEDSDEEAEEPEPTFGLEKISNSELFDMLHQDSVVIDSRFIFPKFEEINSFFWFLYNLGQLDISEAKFKAENEEELSILYYQFIEAGVFFRFFDRGEEDGDVYVTPTELYEDFMEQSIREQYLTFIKAMGQNQTLTEILTIQLNEPIFDRISKQMVHRKLAGDTNIIRENLEEEEIDKIVTSLRYWYLDIKNVLLEE